MTEDRVDKAAALFPLDGPYSPDVTTDAARTIAELVRYLNHATQTERALEYPSQLSTTVAALRRAVHGMDQLCEQLAEHAVRVGRDARLYDDRGGNPATTAAEVIGGLRTTATLLPDVENALRGAARAADRLGFRD